jgi:hypothetical protein
MVSPSTPDSLSMSVAPVSESTACPHEEQNRAFAETLAPQVEQNMEARILPSVRGPPRTPHTGQETRSTCTAVPYASTSVTPCITSVAS